MDIDRIKKGSEKGTHLRQDVTSENTRNVYVRLGKSDLASPTRS